MKTTITFELGRAEIKAAAKHQDVIQETMRSIFGALGKDIPKEPSAWQKTKLALGKEETISGSNSNRGFHNDWTIVYSKRGIKFTASVEIDETVITEVYAMYGDLFKIYAPVMTSAVTGVIAAKALAEERVSKSMQVLKKL